MSKIVSCIVFEHDYRLVALSAAICVLGCFAVTTSMAQSELSGKRSFSLWMLASACIYGCSVWSLHFVAMLAFLPAAHIAYELDVTGASIVVSVLGTLLSLRLWHLLPRTPIAAVLPGTILGLSVAGMHYLGVVAMQASSMVAFDPSYVVASIVLSTGFGILALARARTLLSLGRRIEVTIWLALAICGLHFTGMAAVSITPLASRDGSDLLLGSTQLGFAVGSISLLVLVTGLTALLLQQHLSRRSLNEINRMRLLSNLSHEVLLIHRDGRVLEVNNAGTRLFGMPIEEIIGMPILDLFAQADAPALIRRATRRSEDLHPEEFEVRTGAGVLVPVELSCRPIEFGGKPATAVALRDLTALRRDEARIRHLALHDALTDLPNRYLMEQRINHALAAAAEVGNGLAVIYLDLDRFKPVNDRYGHAAGDELLAEVAKRLRRELRPTDTLARIGGDEFVAVLSQAVTPAYVSEVATRLLAELTRPFRVDTHTIEIGASAGIALYPDDGSTVDSLLRAADTALYRVKDEGRGGLRFFEASMDAHFHARRQLEHELSGALARDELRLFYQPIVNARTGEIETFEALIRWQHPERGLVSPAEFIPLAEQTDLIASIGRWVIDTACATAATWPKAWRVSVNVSPTQFRQSDVPAIAAAALARNALDASRLVVEITESVFIQDATNAVDVLSRLRAQGIRLALDDFGSGYSSLNYLQRFKFDKIKIDQSFVRRLGQDADTLTIIRAIVNLGHNLGLHVTVEGVETAEQLAILRRLGCDQMQGYLFARPSPMMNTWELEQARLHTMFADTFIRARA